MPSIAQLEKLLTLDPSDPFVHYGLAQEQAKAGEIDQALESYTKVIELDPTYCYAYFFKGQLLHGQGNGSEAVQVLETGIQAAKQANDAKAISELTSLLQSLT